MMKHFTQNGLIQKNIAAVPVFNDRKSDLLIPVATWVGHTILQWRGKNSIKKFLCGNWRRNKCTVVLPFNSDALANGVPWRPMLPIESKQCWHRWRVALAHWSWKKLWLTLWIKGNPLQFKINKSLYFDCTQLYGFDDKFSMVYLSRRVKSSMPGCLANWEKNGSSGKSIHKQQNNYSISDRVSHERTCKCASGFFNDKMISIFILQSSKICRKRLQVAICFTILIKRKSHCRNLSAWYSSVLIDRW